MQSLVGKQHSTGMFHSECHTHNKTVMTRKDWKGVCGGEGGMGGRGVIQFGAADIGHYNYIITEVHSLPSSRPAQ